LAGLVGEALQRHGRLDALLCVANRAAGQDGPIVSLDPAFFDAVLGTDLRDAFLAARCALPALVRSGGSIVFAAGAEALPGRTATAGCTAAGGLVTFMKCIVYQYGPRGVRANALVPGLEDLAGRCATDEDAARVALFLSSGEASYVTGIVMTGEQPGPRPDRRRPAGPQHQS
jgi:NAD(P)-dependent dehydrogenase (short-subunit alcohol dehydrogenase family)